MKKPSNGDDDDDPLDAFMRANNAKADAAVAKAAARVPAPVVRAKPVDGYARHRAPRGAQETGELHVFERDHRQGAKVGKTREERRGPSRQEDRFGQAVLRRRLGRRRFIFRRRTRGCRFGFRRRLRKRRRRGVGAEAAVADEQGG